VWYIVIQINIFFEVVSDIERNLQRNFISFAMCFLLCACVVFFFVCYSRKKKTGKAIKGINRDLAFSYSAASNEDLAWTETEKVPPRPKKLRRFTKKIGTEKINACDEAAIQQTYSKKLSRLIDKYKEESRMTRLILAICVSVACLVHVWFTCSNQDLILFGWAEDIKTLKISSLIVLCIIWRVYSLPDTMISMSETPQYGSLSVAFEKLSVIDVNGDTFAILSQPNYDNNQLTVAVRTIIVKYYDCVTTAYLFPSEAICFPNPYQGKSFALTVHYLTISGRSTWAVSEESKSFVYRFLTDLGEKNSTIKSLRVFQNKAWEIWSNGASSAHKIESLEINIQKKDGE